jgi:hypothetical protein
MQSARSNFSALVIDQFIYVLGGISGGDEKYKPIMSQPMCEQYSIEHNKWIPIEISGMSPIAAFAFC